MAPRRLAVDEDQAGRVKVQLALKSFFAHLTDVRPILPSKHARSFFERQTAAARNIQIVPTPAIAPALDREVLPDLSDGDDVLLSDPAKDRLSVASSFEPFGCPQGLAARAPVSRARIHTMAVAKPILNRAATAGAESLSLKIASMTRSRKFWL